MHTSIRTKLRRKLSLASARQGFSLVELLVVIAVIGIIAAIAIPNIAGITGSANSAKTQRNAQSVASAFSSARAAGNASTPADKDAAIDSVTTSPGLSGVGTLSSSTFYVPLSAAEVTAVKADTHLSLTGAGANAILTYTP